MNKMDKQFMDAFPDWVDRETLIEGARAIIGACRRINHVLTTDAAHAGDAEQARVLSDQGNALRDELERVNMGEEEALERAYTAHKKFADENKQRMLDIFAQRFPEKEVNTDE